MSSKLHEIILSSKRLRVTKKDIDEASKVVKTKYPDRVNTESFAVGILGEVMYKKKRNGDIIQPERGSEFDRNGIDFIDENGKNIDLKCPLIEENKIRIFIGSEKDYFKDTSLYALSILLKEDGKLNYIEVGYIEPKVAFTKLPYIVSRRDGTHLRYIMINSQFKRFSQFLI